MIEQLKIWTGNEAERNMPKMAGGGIKPPAAAAGTQGAPVLQTKLQGVSLVFLL